KTLGGGGIVKQREDVTLYVSYKQVVEKLDCLGLFGPTAAAQRSGGAANVLGTIDQGKQSKHPFLFPLHIFKQRLMEQPAVVHRTIIVISKKRKKSQESSVIAPGFRDNSHLYDMSVYGQIRQASGHLFEAENYFVAERTVVLVEAGEKRTHRVTRLDFAQRPGNTESDITRDVGIQERVPQSFDRNLTIFDQGLARPTLGLRTAESHDNISQKRRVLSLAGSSQRLPDHRDGGVFPNQFA